MGGGFGFFDDWRENTFIVLVVVVVTSSAFVFFSGLDSQLEYMVSTPGDYFSFTGNENKSGVYFNQDDIELMNEVSSRSLGSDAVADERLYCGETTNQVVNDFRFADSIKGSSLTSVSGSCIKPVDIWVHSQPDGSSTLSEEDMDLESTGSSYTCIQYSEITVSPFTGKLNGLNCWDIVRDGSSFEMVDVYLN